MVGPPSDELIALRIDHRNSCSPESCPFPINFPSARVPRSGKAGFDLNTMNSKMALLILAHGVSLIVLSLLTNKIAPEIARVTLITGIAGGLLCGFWGTLALLRVQRRVGAVLTLIAISLVLITQAVGGWVERVLGKPENVLALVIMTLMLILSVGVLAYVLHAEGEQENQRQNRE